MVVITWVLLNLAFNVAVKQFFVLPRIASRDDVQMTSAFTA